MTETTYDDDLPLHHFSVPGRLKAWINLHLLDGVTYTVRRGLLKGMKRKGGFAWLPTLFEPKPTPEYQFWSDLNLTGMTLYDVGAYQGLLTIFFATRARHVVCFEPNNQNNARLVENLNLNAIRNVDVRKVGVGSRQETLQMVGNPLMSGRSSVEKKIVEEMKNTGLANTFQDISIVTLDEEIAQAGLPVPDFIKIDIEGWEIEALRGARRTIELHKPTLFLEMHGETMGDKKRKVAEIVRFLWDLDYRNVLHIETGTPITPDNSAVAVEGHLYCKSV